MKNKQTRRCSENAEWIGELWTNHSSSRVQQYTAVRSYEGNDIAEKINKPFCFFQNARKKDEYYWVRLLSRRRQNALYHSLNAN